MICIGPKAKDADLWIAIWEKLNKLHSEEVWIEVEHVSWHIALRRRGNTCRSSKSVSLGAIRKRMSPQRKERWWMEGLWRRQEQVRSRRSVRSLAVCSQLSLLGGRMERLRTTRASAKRILDFRGQEMRGNEAPDRMVRQSWRMRCGRSRKYMQGTCTGPKWLTEDSKRKLGRWCKSHLGGHDMVRGVEKFRSSAEHAPNMRDQAWDRN